MAQYFAFTFNGKNYEARCSSRSTRNGFAHDCTVWDENYNDITEATCHYLNRTWECFRFESVLHNAISQIAEEQAEAIVEQWKEDNGKTRISAKKREELTAPTWEAKNLAYDTIKMENRKHFRFYFACRDTSECLYDGYFDTDAEMITFAQGLCVGLRHFRKTASVHVYILEKNDTVGRLYRIQR